MKEQCVSIGQMSVRGVRRKKEWSRMGGHKIHTVISKCSVLLGTLFFSSTGSLSTFYGKKAYNAEQERLFGRSSLKNLAEKNKKCIVGEKYKFVVMDHKWQREARRVR